MFQGGFDLFLFSFSLFLVEHFLVFSLNEKKTEIIVSEVKQRAKESVSYICSYFKHLCTYVNL